jgi:hypothetical protein
LVTNERQGTYVPPSQSALQERDLGYISSRSFVPGQAYPPQ